MWPNGTSLVEDALADAWSLFLSESKDDETIVPPQERGHRRSSFVVSRGNHKRHERDTAISKDEIIKSPKRARFSYQGMTEYLKGAGSASVVTPECPIPPTITIVTKRPAVLMILRTPHQGTTYSGWTRIEEESPRPGLEKNTEIYGMLTKGLVTATSPKESDPEQQKSQRSVAVFLGTRALLPGQRHARKAAINGSGMNVTEALHHLDTMPTMVQTPDVQATTLLIVGPMIQYVTQAPLTMMTWSLVGKEAREVFPLKHSSGLLVVSYLMVK
jgi:hypothetical protein